ncbi:MAG: LysR family transcriptional regulator [Oscillospiraceae bacterium]|nr:LysR family transcriptional regulator [Oscillospiraceae bacterium]
MTLNQLKYFIAVVRCLSFTEAAKSLFMTQPALSRQIQAMEAELGTQLFIRDKKTLKLTPGGSALYSKLPDFLRQYEEMMEDARNANRDFEGQLRIGFLDIYDASQLFPPVVEAFQRSHGGVRLTMERFSLGELPERLYEGKLDIICTYGFSLFDKPDLVTVNVQKFDSCVMFNKDHPLANKPDLTMDDLRQERFIQLGREASQEGYQYIANLISRGGISPKVQYVEKNDDVLLWVEMGCGIAVTSDRTVERHNPKVVIRELNMPEVKGHDVTMAWRRSNYNPAIALFMELMEKEAEKQA